TQGIGTVRSHSQGPEYEDDGGLSSESDASDYDDDDESADSSDEEGEEDEGEFVVDTIDDTSHVQTPTASNATSPTISSTIHTPVPRSVSATVPVTPTGAPRAQEQAAIEPPHLNITPASPIGGVTDPIASLDTTMGGTAPPQASQQGRPSPSPRLSGMIPRIPKFPKPKRSDTSSSQPETPDSPTAVIDLGADISAPPEEEKTKEEKKKRFRKSWGSRRPSGNVPTVGTERTASESSGGSGSGGSSGNERTERRKERKERSRRKSEYSFGAQNDIVGIVMLEIQNASDLPRLKNSE
ncbi:hypothetical protein MPER_07987, partial [Moniliophthora perniciosa FA553]